ncbi:MAG: DUF4446 family protein [Candidatus Baltobacteraceae bacterium]
MAALYAAGAAFAGALVALIVYHAAVARPALERLRRLVEVHDGLIVAGAGGAVDRLGSVEAGQAAATAELGNLSRRLDELEALAQSDLSRAGFVRYDAFSEAGSGLSYALALLNRRGDGVVLNSIYSREDARTYGKPVAAFKPTIQASAEELEAIERARQVAS